MTAIGLSSETRRGNKIALMWARILSSHLSTANFPVWAYTEVKCNILYEERRHNGPICLNSTCSFNGLDSSDIYMYQTFHMVQLSPLTKLFEESSNGELCMRIMIAPSLACPKSPQTNHVASLLWSLCNSYHTIPNPFLMTIIIIYCYSSILNYYILLVKFVGMMLIKSYMYLHVHCSSHSTLFFIK